MIKAKGIVEVHEGYADKSELLESLDLLPDGEYGYLLFDKKKNRSLPQLKFLFGHVLRILSEKLEGNPPVEALYRYFEEMFAPLHICKIPGRSQTFSYFDLKNEPPAEMGKIIEQILHHAKTEWGIEILNRSDLKEPEAAELYAGAYADTWKNYSRKLNSN